MHAGLPEDGVLPPDLRALIDHIVGIDVQLGVLDRALGAIDDHPDGAKWARRRVSLEGSRGQLVAERWTNQVVLGTLMADVLDEWRRELARAGLIFEVEIEPVDDSDAGEPGEESNG